METKHFVRLGHPVFVASIILLVINDWILKACFHNVVTGKLSDFAGLVAFPFFFSVLFPQRRVAIHLATMIVFVWWKSPWSQPLIDVLNSYDVPFNRVIDLTDNIALLSLIVSWRIRDSNVTIFRGRTLSMVMVVIACVAFTATSMPPGQYQKISNINKRYDFDFSKHELVSRFNALQAKTVYDISKAYGARADFDKASGVFRYRETGDTLAIILDASSADTLFYKSSFAAMWITGDYKKSSITLLSVTGFKRAGKKTDIKLHMISYFEKQVVRKLKKKFPDLSPRKL